MLFYRYESPHNYRLMRIFPAINNFRRYARLPRRFKSGLLATPKKGRPRNPTSQSLLLKKFLHRTNLFLQLLNFDAKSIPVHPLLV